MEELSDERSSNLQNGGLSGRTNNLQHLDIIYEDSQDEQPTDSM
jgi:hypothetical protein